MGPLVVEADGEMVEAIKEEYEREKKAGKVGDEQVLYYSGSDTL